MEAMEFTKACSANLFGLSRIQQTAYERRLLGAFEYLVFCLLIFCLYGCGDSGFLNDKDAITVFLEGAEKHVELSGLVASPSISNGRILYGSHIPGDQTKLDVLHVAVIDSPLVVIQYIPIDHLKGVYSFDFVSNTVLVAQSIYASECVYYFDVNKGRAYIEDSICGQIYRPVSVQVFRNWLIVNAFNGLFVYDKESKDLVVEFLNDFPSQPAGVQYLVEDDGVYIFVPSAPRRGESVAESHETTVYKLSADNLKVEWKTIVHGKLYQGINGDVYSLGQSILIFLKNDQSFVSAIDKDSGRVLWSFTEFDDVLNRAYGVSNLVCIDARDVLLALDSKSGKEEWRYYKDRRVHTYGFRGRIICSMNGSIGSFDLSDNEIVDVFSYSHRGIDVLVDECGNEYLLIDSMLFW